MSILKPGKGASLLSKTPFSRPRIQIETAQVHVETFVSDPPTSGQMDDNEKEKVFNKVKTLYNRTIRDCAAGIQAFLKQEFQPGTAMTPSEHFVMKQTCLGSVKVLIRLEKEKLAYDDIREHFENLASLLDLLTSRSRVACVYLSRLMVMSMRVMKELCGHLEDLAGRQVTDWVKLSAHYEEFYNKNWEERPLPKTPALKHFSKCQAIAYGSQGTVHCAQFGQGLDIMLKVVCKKKNKATNSPFNTALVASMNRHPLLVNVYCTFVTREAYIAVMEYFSGVDCQRLVNLNGSFPTDVTIAVTAQICLALEYLHYIGFIHRDLKPSNVLMNPESRIKICDYDTCKVCIGHYGNRAHSGFHRRTAREFKDGEIEGTLAYIAPEVLRKDFYGRAIDWWAMGVTAYTLRCGSVPFAAKKEVEMKKLLRRPRITWEDDDQSQEYQMLQDFVAKALKVSLRERLCNQNYSEYRTQPLFADADWATLEKADAIVSYDPAWDVLIENAGKYQPKPNIPRKEKRDKSYIWKLDTLQEQFDPVLLCTYISEGFKRAMEMAAIERPITLEDVEEPPEGIPAFTEKTYKFSNYFKTVRL